jgi:hypothetical protein
MENIPPGYLKCTKPHCKTLIPPSEDPHVKPFKKCERCRSQDNASVNACRKRKREETQEPPACSPPHIPSETVTDVSVGSRAEIGGDSSDEEYSAMVRIAVA